MNTRKDKQKQQRAQLNSHLEFMELERVRKEKEHKLDLWKSDVLTDLAKLILESKKQNSMGTALFILAIVAFVCIFFLWDSKKRRSDEII